MFGRMFGVFFSVGLIGSLLNPSMAAVGSDFSGTWVLNDNESEFPAASGDANVGQLQGSEMTIVQQEGELKISSSGRRGPFGNTREETLKPGAGTQKTETFSGEVTIESEWEGDQLIVKRSHSFETPRGDTVRISQRATWELSSDGRKVIIRLQTKNPRGTSYSKLVYDKK